MSDTYTKAEIKKLVADAVDDLFQKTFSHFIHLTERIKKLEHLIKETGMEEKIENFSQRPPLGLMPVKIWQEQRKKDVEDAILRYVVAGYAVQDCWIAELQTLNAILSNESHQR